MRVVERDFPIALGVGVSCAACIDPFGSRRRDGDNTGEKA